MKLRKPDLITLLLLLFLAAIPATLLFLLTINKNIRHYATQSNTITQLELLDKDFNYFISQKGVFHNYDIINRKVATFKNSLNRISEGLRNDHHIKAYGYEEVLQPIEESFARKSVLIEHAKSYNSLVINSLNYLHDLQRNIRRYTPLNEEDYRLLDDTIFLTLQTYTRTRDALPDIKKNLQKIERLSGETDDNMLRYFVTHMHVIVNQIETIDKEHSQIAQLALYPRLTALHQKLNTEYADYLTFGKMAVLLILASLAALLFLVLYLHKRSLADKKVLDAYRYAIENSDNSIVITNADQEITYVNDAFERETGYSKEEVMGENPKILKSNLMDRSFYEALKTALRERKRWDGEFVNKRKDGSLFYEKASISPLIVDDMHQGYIAIKLNITKYVEQENHVKHLAYHDQLTGLPNRLHFQEHFQQLIHNTDGAYALLYIDMDYFKTINDTLGHHTGDILLQLFAQRLQHELSREDFIARIGGDEFVAVLKIAREADALKVAERILHAMHAPFEIEQHKLNITTSIGISLYPRDGTTLEELMKHADTAMYKAKKNGRNNAHTFTQQLSDVIHQRLEIEQELRKALDNNELYLVYQPKYDLHTRKTLGFEALIRWENEKLGFVPPDKFIPVAEEIGLIDEIGFFVFEEACSAFHRFKEIDPDLKQIAINVSTIQFRQKDFIRNLNALSFKTGLHPTQIELEVTESYVMEDIGRNIDNLQSLRNNGYKIAIDDFGTGYSSFSYLKKLPITTLKIDKSFVDDICTDPKDRNIAMTIVTLAKNLGFETVAEGIEDQMQETLLLEMGCSTGQGYHFSRPLKPDDVVTFLRQARMPQKEPSESGAC